MSLRKEYLWLIGIIPFMFIGLYAEPIADDYAYAYRLQLQPYWSNYVNEYFTWNGRFTSNLLVLLNDRLIENRLLYHLSPGLIIASLTASVYFMFRSFLAQKDSLRISLPAVVLYLGSNARISEVIYWYTATLTYTAGTILTVLAIGALIRFARTEKFIWGFGACLFIFLSSGSNEISMAINILVALVYAQQNQYRWFVILATAIAAAGIVYFAPGNAVRSGFFPNAHNILYSIGMSAAQTIRFTLRSLSYLLLPFTILLIWRYANFKNFNNSLAVFVKETHILWIIGAIFTPLFLSAFLPYYATGLLGQHRTIAFGQFYLILLLMALPYVLYVHYPAFFETLGQRLQSIPFGLFLTGMLFSFLFLGNSRKALFETINGALANQQKELLFREYRIRNAKQDTALYFQPLDTTLLFVIDLSQNPDYWINKHQSTVLNPHFAVSTIVTKDQSIKIEKAPKN